MPNDKKKNHRDLMCVGCRHFEMIPFRFAQLHHFCIPAYTHQIPNGISSHFLIYSRSKYAYPVMGFYKKNRKEWILMD